MSTGVSDDALAAWTFRAGSGDRHDLGLCMRLVLDVGLGYRVDIVGTGSCPQLDQAVAKQLDAAIDGPMKTAAIPGVIVGIWRPDGDYVKAFGVADKATDRPTPTQTIHRRADGDGLLPPDRQRHQDLHGHRDSADGRSGQVRVEKGRRDHAAYPVKVAQRQAIATKTGVGSADTMACLRL